MTWERLGALWAVIVLVPIMFFLYRHREDSRWARESFWVGALLIIVMLFLFIFDPEPRYGR
jgi:hypothetical protein